MTANFEAQSVVEEKIKQNLQESMKRQLAVLRDILTSFHHEHSALMQENYPALKGIVEDRLHLMEVFQNWNERFLQSFDELSEQTTAALSSHPDHALVSLLEELQMYLKPDDVELLLLSGQLKEILGEIQRETGSLLHFLEHPGSLNEDPYLIKAPSQSHLAPMALALIEEGQEEGL